jgi:hypothetical protein
LLLNVPLLHLNVVQDPELKQVYSLKINDDEKPYIKEEYSTVDKRILGQWENIVIEKLKLLPINANTLMYCLAKLSITIYLFRFNT